MNLQKFKLLNLRQPKYIFPLVIFLPLLGLIYFGMETFKGNGKTTGNVVTDSINMSIPDARGTSTLPRMEPLPLLTASATSTNRRTPPAAGTTMRSGSASMPSMPSASAS